MIVYDTIAERQAASYSTPERARIAREAIDDFRASAPEVTGAYKAGGAVEESGDDVLMVNRDPDAVYKEYGTSDTPAHAAMTNAARRHGRYSGWNPYIWQARRRT